MLSQESALASGAIAPLALSSTAERLALVEQPRTCAATARGQSRAASFSSLPILSLSFSLSLSLIQLTGVTRRYMDDQPHINARMRAILADWLVEVCAKYKQVRAPFACGCVLAQSASKYESCRKWLATSACRGCCYQRAARTVAHPASLLFPCSNQRPFFARCF